MTKLFTVYKFYSKLFNNHSNETQQHYKQVFWSESFLSNLPKWKIQRIGSEVSSFRKQKSSEPKHRRNLWFYLKYVWIRTWGLFNTTRDETYSLRIWFFKFHILFSVLSVKPTRESRRKEKEWKFVNLYSPLKPGCRAGNNPQGSFYILLDPRTSVYIDWFHLGVCIIKIQRKRHGKENGRWDWFCLELHSHLTVPRCTHQLVEHRSHLICRTHVWFVIFHKIFKFFSV